MDDDAIDRAEHVDLILREAQDRVDDLKARREATSSRAGVLIASSAIVISLLEFGSSEWATIPSLVFGIAAVFFGVYAIFPSAAGYTSLLDLRTGIYERGITKAKLWVADDKIRFYNESVGRANKWAWGVRLGFVSISVSVAMATIGLVVRG